MLIFTGKPSKAASVDVQMLNLTGYQPVQLVQPGALMKSGSSQAPCPDQRQIQGTSTAQMCYICNTGHSQASCPFRNVTCQGCGKKELIQDADASPFGIGKVLTHKMEDGIKHPIAFYLTLTETC